MFKKRKIMLQITNAFVIFLLLLFTAAVSYAWVAPIDNPPGGNVSEPINVGNTPQYKDASLGIGGEISALSGYFVNRLDILGNSYVNTIYDKDDANYYLDLNGTSTFKTINLGGVSRSSWPSGGTLSVTTVTAGPFYGAGLMSKTAICPTDRLVVGGGFSTTGSAGNNAVLYNAPSGNGWRVDIDNNTTATFGLTVYARCAKVI